MASLVVAEKYVLLRKLGKGGMAEVYLAKQVGLRGFEKLTVLKRILPDRAMDGDFVAMFLDEARLAADLRHPNVINVFDINRADGTYYMAMEFLHGADGRELLKRANSTRTWIPIGQTVEITLGVAAGLHHAHTKSSIDGVPLNIVHRDVSPPNVLIGFQGEVKLVDFGIAKAATQSQQTQAGALKGKYAYMSPEQAEGRPLDHRSDQFALGVLMWEMLTQRRLFKRNTGPATLMAVLEEPAPPATRYRQDVPAPIADIVARALEKKPQNRFADCDELRLALEEAAAAEGISHSAARLAKWLKELWGDPEDEASLSEPQIDDDEIADLSEQYRQELVRHSGRAPRPKKKKGETRSASKKTRREVPEKVSLDDSDVKTSTRSKSRRRSREQQTVASSQDRATQSGKSQTGTRETAMSRKLPAPRAKERSSPDETRIERPPGRSSPALVGVVAALVAAVLLAAGVGIGWLVFRPQEATVIVRTEPKGARVIVDDEDTGERTPHILRPPAGAALKVRVEKKGFAAATSVVQVKAGAPIEVHLVLEPN